MFSLKLVTLAAMLACSVSGSPAVSTSTLKEKMATIGIDLDSCICKRSSEIDCEIALNRLFIPEKDCAKSEYLCCSMKHSSLDIPAESTSAQPPSNINNYTTRKPFARIKEVVPPNGPKPPVIKSSRPAKRGPAKKCRCKTRDKCPDTYIDYSFGFYCTYDKVRCCEPIEVVNKTSQAQNGTAPTIAYELNDSSGGKVINVYNPTDYDASENRTQCVCAEATRCSITRTENTTGESSRNPCPNDLVECCGPLLKQPEQNTATEFEVVEDADDLDPNFIAHRSDEGLKPGMFVNVDPIGLPVNKLPAISETVPVETQVTSTLPPPSLPDQYYYPPANRYQHDVHQIQHPQILQPSTYRTWTDKFGNKYLVDQNGRASLIVSGRSNHNDKSFFSQLAGLFG